MPDDLDRCLRTAMGKLKRSVLSESQLRGKLTAAGYDEAVIDAAVAKLRTGGALDDEALGRALLAELRRRKGAGPRLLHAKLMSKGLDESLIERLMNEPAEVEGAGEGEGDASEGSPGNEADQATALARQTLPTLRGDRMSQAGRLAGLLARRGYSEDAIAAALERVDLDSPSDA
jgi:regulatory protein